MNHDAGKIQTSDNAIENPRAMQSRSTLEQEAGDFSATSTTPLTSHWMWAVPGSAVRP